MNQVTVVNRGRHASDQRCDVDAELTDRPLAGVAERKRASVLGRS
jgi:hypothetical protein